jgi:hypothetical protein
VYRLAPAAPARPPCEPEEAIDRTAFTVTASGEGTAAWAADGDPRTAWQTARPQQPGDRVELRLAAPEPVAAVVLGLGYPFDEFARNLVLMVDDETDGWRRVPYADGPEERWATLRELLDRPRSARLVLRTEPRRVKAVRLMVGWREDDPSLPRWRVPELALYRTCR